MKLIVSVLPILISASASGLEISNFKSGLVCSDGKEFSTICHPLEEIYISGQSSCIYNKKKMPCTWFGFSFDYINAAQGDEIVCTEKSALPENYGTPEKVTGEKMTESTYKIRIDPEKKKFFNPQFTTFEVKPQSEAGSVTETRCTYNDKELFRFKFNLRYPVQSD